MAMSTQPENADSPVQTATATMEIPSPQENKISCGICESNITSMDTHLTCTEDKCRKITCSDCITTMIRMFFAQPTLNFPLQCGACQTPFDELSVERVVISEDYYEKYIACVLPLYWSEACLQVNEKLVKCPYCPYLEIHTTDACPIEFLNCQHPNCGKRSCLICLKALQNDSDTELHRARCVEYRHCKELIEEAIETGSLRRCPHCGLTGIKDSNCTHMTCERCEGRWCYVCGIKEEELPVDDDDYPNFSAHNNDWETNSDRCPMYLARISDIDGRWPGDDEDCLEFFHRCLALQNLYNVLESISENSLEALNDEFSIINAYGYSIDEIQNGDNRILIKRT